MCWMSSSAPVKRIAEKDRKVYKVLNVDAGGSIRSPYYVSMEWKLGEVFSSNIKMGYANDFGVTINEGLHSFSCAPDLERDFRGVIGVNKWVIGLSPKITHCDGDVVFECVIPKGSIYYENEYGDIVSNKLKVIKKL